MDQFIVWRKVGDTQQIKISSQVESDSNKTKEDIFWFMSYKKLVHILSIKRLTHPEKLHS